MTLEKLIPVILPFAIGCTGVQTPSPELKIKAREERVVEEGKKVKEEKQETGKKLIITEVKKDTRPLTEVARNVYTAISINHPRYSADFITMGDYVNGNEYRYKFIKNSEGNVPGLAYRIIPGNRGVVFDFHDLDTPEVGFPLGRINGFDCQPADHLYCLQLLLSYTKGLPLYDEEIAKFVDETVFVVYDSLVRLSEKHLKNEKSPYLETKIQAHLEGLFNAMDPTSKKPKTQPDVI